MLTFQNHEMVKHPEKLGFKLGIKIYIGRPACITYVSSAARKARDVVYVAVLSKTKGSLRKKQALKIGQAKSLQRRWEDIAGIFGQDRKLRPNVKADRKKWLEAANRKEVSVWMRIAGKIRIPYAKGLTQSVFSRKGAEEEFLDEYYEPKIGKNAVR